MCDSCIQLQFDCVHIGFLFGGPMGFGSVWLNTCCVCVCVGGHTRTHTHNVQAIAWYTIFHFIVIRIVTLAHLLTLLPIENDTVLFNVYGLLEAICFDYCCKTSDNFLNKFNWSWKYIQNVR